MADTYLGRDYGDHIRQYQEYRELIGMLDDHREPEWQPSDAIRFVEPVTFYPLDERPR